VVVAVPVAPTALLFLLPFLSFVAVPGVIGLFSPPLLPFLLSFGNPVVCICFGGCALKGVAVAITGFGATSFGFVTRKDPGSPTNGLESMYSLPYVRQRLRDSERVWSADCSALGLLRVADNLLLAAVSCVPGMGVLSLLLCVGLMLAGVVKGLDVGGR